MFGILRTILAINVVLLHVFKVPVLGNYSVTFFFVLSGFLMTYIMHKTYGFDFKGVKFFWFNRFLRLYPTYWIVLILSLLAIVLFDNIAMNKSMNFPVTIKEWATNITMIYDKILPYKAKSRVVPTSWALTNELVYYLLISLGISKTPLRTFVWLGISILYFVATYVYYDIPSYRYGAIPASSLPFALGAVLYWLNEKIKLKNINLIVIIALFIGFNVNAFLFARSQLYVLREAAIYISII